MIVVAGGSGFLGRHIVRALAFKGASVAILSREPARVPEYGQKETRPGDVRDRGSLDEAIVGCEAVVMAAQFPGHPVEKPRRGRSYDAVDRMGTENLIVAAKSAGVGRFVYISGAGAGDGRPEPWFVAKDHAEELVRSSGMSWMILRPSWSYGDGDRALNRIARIARFSPVVPVLGWNRQKVMPVWAGDVGSAVASAFEVSTAWDRVFEIGGPDVLTMREVVRTLMRVLGLHRLLVPLPKILAKVATAPLALLPRPPLTPRAVDFATADALVDSSDVREVLNIDPVSLPDGLTRVFR